MNRKHHAASVKASVIFTFIACAAVATASMASTSTQSQDAATTSNGGTRAEVPMDANTKRPAIMAQINGGAPFEVTFDTGAQGAVISRSFADKLGLEVIGEALVGSPEGGTPVQAKVVSLGRLTVGGYPAALNHAVVMDDARLPKGATIIIGNNQFPDARIELDFASAKFRLTKSAAGTTADWIPLSDRGLTMGTIEIGGESIPLYVDSGNPGWLDIPKSYAARLPLKGPFVDAPEMRLVDRVVPRVAAPMDTEARIGGTALTLRGTFMFADVRFANLGAAALKNAQIEIDMPSKKWRLTFTGGERPVISPPPAPRSGSVVTDTFESN